MCCLSRPFRRALTLGAFIGLPTFSPAVDPYKSNLDRSYDSLSKSISRAFAVPSSNYSAPSYKSSISSGSSSNSSSYNTRSYGSYSQGTRSTSPNASAVSTSAPRDFAAERRGRQILDRLEAARRNTSLLPKPPAASVARIIQYYVQNGVDFRTAQAQARLDWIEYEEQKDRTARYAARAKADERERLLLAGKERDRAATAAQIKRVTDAQARAKTGGIKALDEWIDLAFGSSYLFPKGQVLEWAEEAAAKGSSKAAHTAMAFLPEGSTRWEKFRQRRIELGDYTALRNDILQYKPPVAETDTRALEILEKGYAANPHTAFAADIVRILIKRTGDVPRNTARALEWALKAQHATEGFHTSRHELLLAIAADREAWATGGPAILAEWERLGREPVVYDWKTHQTNPFKTRLLLADLYGGRLEKEFPGVPRDLNRANRYASEVMRAELPAHVYAFWGAGYFFETGQFDDAERIYARLVSVDQIVDRVKWAAGLFWRDRTDGKADLVKAIALMDAGKTASPDSARALADSYFRLGDTVKAHQVLRWGIEQKQPSAKFRLALAFYAAEGVAFETYWGDKYLNELEEETKGSSRFADLRREGAFRRVAAPLLHRLKVIESEGYEKPRENSRRRDASAPQPPKPWVLTKDGNAPVEKMWTQIVSSGLAQTRAKAKAMDEAAPQLRVLAIDGYEPAQKLWGQIILSGLPQTTPEDIELGRGFLRQAAEQGDSDAALVLGESLFSEGLRKIALGTSAAETEAILIEAADWLETSQSAGHQTVRFSLATLYRDGLGRPKSLMKARDLFQALEKEGDADASLALASLAQPSAAGKR